VAAQLIGEGKDPYDWTVSGPRQRELGRTEAVKTFSPPWTLLLALPLGQLSFVQATYVNLAINLALLGVCGVAWAKLHFPTRKGISLVLLLSLPLWMPALAVMGIGQYSLWPLAGFTGWLWFTRSGRPVLAGMSLALLVVKPHLGLLPGVFAGVHMLRRGQWGAIASFLLVLGAVTLLTYLIRPGIWREYFEAVSSGTTPTDICTATLDGWGRKVLGQWFGYISWSIWSFGLLGAGILGWRLSGLQAKAPEASLLVDWSVLVCLASVAVTPYAFSFDFVMMLPGYFWAVGRWQSQQDARGRWVMLGWLALSGWLVLGKFLPWDESAYWIVPWAGLGLMGWVFGARLAGLRGELRGRSPTLAGN
jgi:hypothetical protein